MSNNSKFRAFSPPKPSGLLGPNFAGGALSDDELRAYAATAGQPSVDVSVLRKLVMHGRAESFRLAVPTEANGDWGANQPTGANDPIDQWLFAVFWVFP